MFISRPISRVITNSTRPTLISCRLTRDRSRLSVSSMLRKYSTMNPIKKRHRLLRKRSDGIWCTASCRHRISARDAPRSFAPVGVLSLNRPSSGTIATIPSKPQAGRRYNTATPTIPSTAPGARYGQGLASSTRETSPKRLTSDRGMITREPPVQCGYTTATSARRGPAGRSGRVGCGGRFPSACEPTAVR
ncbi:hypothetical protein D3C80_1331390 [compost metagenome]